MTGSKRKKNTLKPQRKLNIALISDALTECALASECCITPITPWNRRYALKLSRPDFLLVESSWQGHKNRWKYKIASYKEHPERTNTQLRDLVERARDMNIPTVFWNKEDGVHFDRFIDSAKLFDHVFTVDENCIPRYREAINREVTVNALMFGVQPVHHNFSGFKFKHVRANFVGSYGHHVHDRRRYWQDLMFSAAAETGLGLTVVDRNSDRKSTNYRFPSLPTLEIHPALSHERTAQIYKDYLVSLNVNTIEDSTTMYSRRLVEILACGGIAVTNPSPAVDRYFKDFCHVVHDRTQATELFSRLKHGPSADDLARAEAGARYVMAEHTWSHRLAEIARVVGL